VLRNVPAIDESSGPLLYEPFSLFEERDIIDFTTSTDEYRHLSRNFHDFVVQPDVVCWIGFDHIGTKDERWFVIAGNVL
jgi:hypothetical protein